MDGKFFAVIGKNFGDEGKGYTVDFLCKEAEHSLVVRANGGAQAGHTVVNDGRRFVFHELSSGSFCGADTFWAKTFHPDLFKLREEYDDFKKINGEPVKIFADSECGITIIDDVLINMALEVSRGRNRHGSCGMGIYECELREVAGYKITVEDIRMNGSEWLYDRLKEIRNEYEPARTKHIDVKNSLVEGYLEMLKSDDVLINFAEVVYENLSLVEVVEEIDVLLENYDRVVFENGQGLLLDSECERFIPNVTGSRTGLTNINEFMNEYAPEEDLNVFYVTRTYVTRHGAGALPCECPKEKLGQIETDKTNIKNPWQGSIRYAYHESVEAFFEYMEADIKCYEGKLHASVLLTHVNETDGMVRFIDQDISVENLAKNNRSCGYDFYASSGENMPPIAVPTALK